MPLETQPTHTLVDQAAAGDHAAVEVLCARLQGRLKVWARGRLPDYARSLKDTDDLVQEALTRSVSRLAVFSNETEGSFLRYLQRAVKNLILNEIRRTQSQNPAGELDANIADTGQSPIERFVDRESLTRYETALDRLTAEEQELVVARLELDMSFQEIALHTGRPSADAARMAVTRAVRKLAKVMDDGSTEQGNA